MRGRVVLGAISVNPPHFRRVRGRRSITGPSVAWPCTCGGLGRSSPLLFCRYYLEWSTAAARWARDRRHKSKILSGSSATFGAAMGGVALRRCWARASALRSGRGRRVGSERGTPSLSSAGSCSGGRAKTRFAWRRSTDKDGMTRSWQRMEVRRTGRAQGGRQSRGAERATSQLAKLAAGRPARRVRTRVCPHLTGRPPDHCSWTRAVLWRWPRLERMRRRVR